MLLAASNWKSISVMLKIHFLRPHTLGFISNFPLYQTANSKQAFPEWNKDAHRVFYSYSFYSYYETSFHNQLQHISVSISFSQQINKQKQNNMKGICFTEVWCLRSDWSLQSLPVQRGTEGFMRPNSISNSNKSRKNEIWQEKHQVWRVSLPWSCKNKSEPNKLAATTWFVTSMITICLLIQLKSWSSPEVWKVPTIQELQG